MFIKNLDLTSIDNNVLEFIPKSIAVYNNIIPYKYKKDTLYVACVKNCDEKKLENIRFIVNCDIIFTETDGDNLMEALNKYYSEEFIIESLGNLPDIDIRDDIYLGNIDDNVLNLISYEFISENRLIPFKIENGNLYTALSETNEDKKFDYIGNLPDTIIESYIIEFVYCDKERIEKAINYYFIDELEDISKEALNLISSEVALEHKLIPYGINYHTNKIYIATSDEDLGIKGNTFFKNLFSRDVEFKMIDEKVFNRYLKRYYSKEEELISIDSSVMKLFDSHEIFSYELIPFNISKIYEAGFVTEKTIKIITHENSPIFKKLDKLNELFKRYKTEITFRPKDIIIKSIAKYKKDLINNDIKKDKNSNYEIYTHTSFFKEAQGFILG